MKIIKTILWIFFALILLISCYILYFHKDIEYFWNNTIHFAEKDIEICNIHTCFSWIIKSNIVENNAMYVRFYYPETLISNGRIIEKISFNQIWVSNDVWIFFEAEKIPYYLVVFNDNNHYAFFNKSWEQLIENSQKKYIEKSWTDFIIKTTLQDLNTYTLKHKDFLDKNNTFKFWKIDINTNINNDNKNIYKEIEYK